jgi:hypothetical protein
MPRKAAHNVRPSMSSDARDKPLAALNWTHGKSRDSAAYGMAPMYFDACLAWQLADVIGSAHKGAAESMAVARRRRGVRYDDAKGGRSRRQLRRR